MIHPKVQFIGSGRKRLYQLLEGYAYRWQTKALSRDTSGNQTAQWQLVAPAGFIWDGASVPRYAWSIGGLTPGGIYLPASLFHDMLYTVAGRLDRYDVPVYYWEDTADNWIPVRSPWSRKAADRLFARILRESGVPRAQRRRSYVALRLCAWRAWNRNR